MSTLPSSFVVPYTLKFVPRLRFLAIDIPPAVCIAPLAAYVPAAIEASVVLETVVIPVTPRVVVTFVAPLTSRVPSTAVLPEAAATVNLVALILKSPVIDPVPPTVKLEDPPTILTVVTIHT